MRSTATPDGATAPPQTSSSSGGGAETPTAAPLTSAPLASDSSTAADTAPPAVAEEAVDPSSSPSGTTTTIAVVAGAAAVGVALVAAAAVFCLRRRKSGTRKESETGKSATKVGGFDGDGEDDDHAYYSWTREQSGAASQHGDKAAIGELAKIEEGAFARSAGRGDGKRRNKRSDRDPTRRTAGAGDAPGGRSSSVASVVGPSASGSAVEGAGDVAAAVLSAVEALAQDSYVPGVRTDIQ